RVRQEPKRALPARSRSCGAALFLQPRLWAWLWISAGISFHSFDQSHRRGRSAYLGFVDEIDKNVARLFFRGGFGDARKILRLAALRPGFAAHRPAIERFRRIACLELLVALLQPRVDKIAGDVCDGRISVVFGKDHRHVELTQKRDERRRLETVVTDLHDVTQSVPVESLWQQFEESAEIGFVEFLVRRELPEQGAEA